MAVAIGLGMMMSMGAARAQENLDAGKTGAQLFASDCQICHKQPQGLSKAGGISDLEHFLSLHYTAGERSAAVLANYLKSVDRNAAAEPERNTRKRRPRAGAPKPDEKSGAFSVIAAKSTMS
jgi:mono/diheme cytochrome c family protein